MLLAESVTATLRQPGTPGVLRARSRGPRSRDAVRRPHRGGPVAPDDRARHDHRGARTEGAGKTTTLETCEGYRRPHAGDVRVLGLDPWARRRELLPRIGVMLQQGGAWSGVRAMEMLRTSPRCTPTRWTWISWAPASGWVSAADAVPAALRRPAAAARPGDGGGGASGAGLRRRADRGDGPGRAPDDVGPAGELRSAGVTVVLIRTTSRRPSGWPTCEIIDRGRRRRAGHRRPDRRRAGAGGRVPRADGDGALDGRSGLHARSRRRSPTWQVRAQARMETRPRLRNGEQLLLAVVIPALGLVAASSACRTWTSTWPTDRSTS